MKEDIQEDWISVFEKLPDKPNWYEIKTTIGDSVAPFVRNMNEKLVWVVPDPKQITHWRKIRVAAQ